MGKRTEIESHLETMSAQYGVTSIEDQLELLSLHLLSVDPMVEQNALSGSDPMTADLSEFWCGQSGDFGLDGVLYDPTTRGVILIQAAHRSKFSNELEQKARAFFAKLGDFREVASGKTSANKVQEKVLTLLRDSEVDKNATQIKMVFVTDLPTGIGSQGESLSQLAKSTQEQLADDQQNVVFEVMGRADIADGYEHLINTYKHTGVQKESINLGANDFFELGSPYRTLVIALSTNELRDLYNRRGVKNALFNSNVRMALGGKTKINSGMLDSLTNESEEFFYYNNGVTATCSSYSRNGNTVEIENLQVVNGAQTVSTIGNTRHGADSGKVLFRIIETQEKYRKKNDFADKITKYQNTQNPVKASDFYSNEPLQLWLKANLAERVNKFRAATRIWYQHKRGFFASNTNGQRMDLETLAKLRHSCLYNPHMTYNSPKEFWADDKYWEAFGRRGELVSAWTEEELAEVAWMTTTFLNLRARAREIGKKSDRPNPERSYLSYLAIFATALTFQIIVHLQNEDRFMSFADLMATDSNYEACEVIIKKVREKILYEIQDRASRDESNPKFYLARDSRTFEKMRQDIINLIEAGLLEFERAN